MVHDVRTVARPCRARPGAAWPSSPCTSPNRTHGAPLAFPSCTPPGRASPHLTVGSPDANGAPANSIGSVRLDALTGDVGINASITDVRCAVALPTCGAANTAAGPDYIGELRASVDVRRTDKFDSTGRGASRPRSSDSSLEFTFGCGATAAGQGATCSVTTTANSLVPGYVSNGDRTSMELGAIQLLDGGPDGDADTGRQLAVRKQGIRP